MTSTTFSPHNNPAAEKSGTVASAFHFLPCLTLLSVTTLRTTNKECEQNIASETKLPGGLRKKKIRKKKTNDISGSSKSTARSEILIHEGCIFTRLKPRKEKRRSEITLRWARYENQPKKSDGGKKREMGRDV